MEIEHAAIFVRDLERARDFFKEYFGGEANDGYHNPKTGFRSYFLTFDSGARLEIMSRADVGEGEKQTERTGYSHMAFALGSSEAVKCLTERLRADGFPVIREPRTTGDGYFESCVLDPEGNRIELTV